jgi:diadenosine tetraphosphatase ApaH/serine/threonine PP2A family protein phosphatase
VSRKYGNSSVWSRIVEVFTHLPLTALLDHRILCLHGGLSPSSPFLDHIAAIDRFRDIPESGPMCDLVWSDPDPSDHQGWALNNRGAGFLFSREVVAEFLRMNALETIVRAHQLVEEGHVYNFGDRSFVTLWSAPNYCYRCGNEASVMKVEGEQQEFLQFHPSPQTERTKVHFDSLLPYFL